MIDPITSTAPELTSRAVASQRWSHLAFVHWRVDSALVAPLLPKGLRPDEFDGSSWVGLIPFVLDRATVLGSPPVPYFGDFVEINVRLYAVDQHGHRGVVFVTLDAGRLAAVLAARVLFALPYVWSDTTLTHTDDGLIYRGRRHLDRAATCEVVVRTTDIPVVDDPLADFLTARWALYTRVAGRTVRLRNTHAPWQVYEAELVSLSDTLLARAGFDSLAARPPDSVLYSPGVTTRFGR
ncbi:hypothetical protein B0I08_103340 [Glaciihabitans tibetensis]|uniref:DUF2071 domain-containing protein n=1 Tax=Glaciihabitans tibetensis TaxID=1266600 RepID=A0A2T0VG03_9MICO|nr:DUF2071 domain-containing protein [Glaciihabitans tibetensis]PRY69133.1 hypothetical protein B0I08_103340 [Glaciihabitans tibetensis]